MEVTQFTYFQQVGGLECRPVTGEITYGLERLAMYLQEKESVFDLIWTRGPQGDVTYGDVFHQNEVEMSTYNFEQADTEILFKQFDDCESESQRLIELGLPLPRRHEVLCALAERVWAKSSVAGATIVTDALTGDRTER